MLQDFFLFAGRKAEYYNAFYFAKFEALRHFSCKKVFFVQNVQKKVFFVQKSRINIIMLLDSAGAEQISCCTIS